MEFGYNISYLDFIQYSFKFFKHVEDYIYFDQLFKELYETYYGIFDHTKSTNPLDSVKYNVAEEFDKDFIYDGYLRLFLYRELGKKLHMSFDDFINRPRYEINRILRIVDEIDKKKMHASEKMIKELENKDAKNIKDNLEGLI